jgi:hypothetical protein
LRCFEQLDRREDKKAADLSGGLLLGGVKVECHDHHGEGAQDVPEGGFHCGPPISKGSARNGIPFYQYLSSMLMP